MDTPRLRASDADRDRVAAMLREHHAAGRLTGDEFTERLAAAFSAKTLGDLDELMADLPAIDLYRLPDRSVRPRPSPTARDPTRNPARDPARNPARSSADFALLRTTAIVTSIGLYLVSGILFGAWWAPWWLIILVVAFLMARRARRGS
jgi:hypothetical protein